jgi:hypothetical protein
MAKDPAFLFYPGDYLRDTQCLSESVQVAYDRIMCEHMRNICISQAQLNFFTKRLNQEQKEELLMVLDKTEEGFYIHWVHESIIKRKAYSESRSKNRRKSYDNHVKSYDVHMENENEIVNGIKDRAFNKLKKEGRMYPTLEEVKEYFKEKKTKIDPETFWNWYEARGWKDIKKWKSCLVTWEKRQPQDKVGEHKINNDRDIWEKKASKECSNCRGSGSIYAPGTGKYSKCGCVKLNG